MSRLAHVVLVLPDGSEVEAYPGDIIGRSSTADIRIDDPRIFEAHAQVVLRGLEFKLLGLRGELTVDDCPRGKISLRPGLEITVTPGLDLEISRIVPPLKALAMRIGASEAVLLRSACCSIVADPNPRLVRHYVPRAAAHLWSAGRENEWHLRCGKGPITKLRAGQRWHVAEQEVRIVEVLQASQPEQVDTLHTGSWRQRLPTPLRIVVGLEQVHIYPSDARPIRLVGHPATIIRMLAHHRSTTGSTSLTWHHIADRIWWETDDTELKRRRWDNVLTRLRNKLGEIGIRTDIIVSDGTGNVELNLNRFDVLEFDDNP